MISIVLYGRNDNYGYNLHKRAALSFNCMAELLDRDDDEILFVDYNTPDDFPTFPEAIQDTLTKKARQKLRILRVRPSIHKRFSSQTRLVALEPISRNIGVRRSNPANRWVLSTNTDMIFVLQRAASLGDIASDLPAGFYHAPRIEIPETLWESLDRLKPREAIGTARDWGSALHIDEIVAGSPLILYDAPGDFQLMERSDLFRINGFHEGMLLGWHVDSNIAARLTLVHGKTSDLGHEVFGYHCDHTRQITAAHGHSRTENDWRVFVDGIERADIPEQARSWGCPDDQIEEIRLSDQNASVYVSALREQIGERLSVAPRVNYSGATYNKTDYDPRHILPYLADMFVCSRKETKLAWVGARTETLRLFAGVWKRLGFTGEIFVEEGLGRDEGFAHPPNATPVDQRRLLDDADTFIIDLGSPPGEDNHDDVGKLSKPLAGALTRLLFGIIQAEYKRFDRGEPRRQIIVVNAINNTFENLVTTYVGVALTPFSTRMRHGYVLPPPTGKVDWTSRLQRGPAGFRDGSIIRSLGDGIGTVIYGPYQHLFAGRYRLALTAVADDRASFLRSDRPRRLRRIINNIKELGFGYFLMVGTSAWRRITARLGRIVNNVKVLRFGYIPAVGIVVWGRITGKDERQADPIAVLEVASRYKYLAHRIVMPADLAKGEIAIEIEVDEDLVLDPRFALETRLRGLEPLNIAITKLTCERLSNVVSAASGEVPALEIENWLPLLSLGAEGAWKDGCIVNPAAIPGYLCYGPYWALPPGTYEATVTLKLAAALFEGNPSDFIFSFEAIWREEHLGLVAVHREDLGESGGVRLSFVVTPEHSEDPDFAVELRIWDSGLLPLAIQGVQVSRLAEPRHENGLDWLKLMTIGPAGLWEKGRISPQRGRRGLVAHGPIDRYRELREGRYEISVELDSKTVGAPGANEAELTLAMMSRGRRGPELAIDIAASTTSRHVIAFEVSDNETMRGRLPVELHIMSTGDAAGTIEAIHLRRVGESTRAEAWMPFLGADWLPFLRVAAAGERNAQGVAARSGVAGDVLYGPYWELPAGNYRLNVHLERGDQRSGLCGWVDVAEQQGTVILAKQDLDQLHVRQGMVVLPFTIGPGGSLDLETRISKVAGSSFVVTGVFVERGTASE
ncbi:hypothetical protein SAMN05519103_00568 [Rhizobiales bacterium GAS113]|nr:hypothetical protein SAMN05519103_00568 [Rhizobiales bacterium GAS113]